MGEMELKPQQPQQSNWPANAEAEAAAKLDETLHDHAYVDENGLIHDDPLIEEATERPGQEPDEAAEPEEGEAEEEATEEAEEEQPEFELSDELKAAAAQLGLDEAALQNPALREMLQSQIDAQRQQFDSPSPVTSEQQRQAYREQLAQLARDPSVNDPQEVAYFTERLGRALGANSPESWQAAQGLAGTLMEGGLGLVSSVVPRIVAESLPSLINQVMPGLFEMYSEAAAGRAWDAAKASDERFGSLPEFGSKEFKEAARAVLSKNPGFDSLEFRDASGRLLPIHQAMQEKGKLLAHLMAGGKPTVEESAKLIEAGKKQATTSAKRVVAARTLGSGRSSGTFTPKEEENPMRKGFEAYRKTQGAFFKG